ncbi:unnamed protein product [Adineta steineri]|uniref:Transmembrane protein n=1 Tax=Adineta steineri TaxID=433720 RepID=A0A815H8W0_9BILA|nr:unnamed protein product [Adineta steineri]CAF1361101.1 unnamed protein product [Adineta steineri]CAF3620981.1 unnamed protein product [Adineta steineri]
MEGILSMHDEVYPLKSRRKKSSTYLSNSTNLKENTLNKSNIISISYQYIKTMVSQRSVYILGVLNLFLAVIAIICVTQAEDHPEYFSLVYIAVSIFIFYMGTIIFIIILQIIETYKDHNKKTQSSSSINVPLLTPQVNIQSNPVLIQNIPAKLETKTRLLRSQTLPLTLFSKDREENVPIIPSSYTVKDFTQIASSRSALLPKHEQSFETIPKNYQSFAVTTNDQFYPLHTTTTIINDSNDPHAPLLIKPIPFKYYGNNDDNNRTKVKFVDYE